MSTKLSVALPKDLAEKLSEMATDSKRPKSFHIQRAVEFYLAEMVDFQVAYDRLQDTHDPVFSFEDMRNDLEL